jgi:hypothetical protein
MRCTSNGLPNPALGAIRVAPNSPDESTSSRALLTLKQPSVPSALAELQVGRSKPDYFRVPAPGTRFGIFGPSSSKVIRSASW